MTDNLRFRHEFVEFMPSTLEPRVVYVSIEYATAAHLCACGCGIKVVTPISPTDWQLIYDRDTISLKPSIGNWSFECRSHYFISRNNILWASNMSDRDIADGRAQDIRRKDRYYDKSMEASMPSETHTSTVDQAQTPLIDDHIPTKKQKWWQRFLGL